MLCTTWYLCLAAFDLYFLPFCFYSHVLLEILTTMLHALLGNTRYAWLMFSLFYCVLLLYFPPYYLPNVFFSQTVDTYYRRCSSAGYLGNVSVPLLCVNALDDPVCTREAIPWDECRWSCFCYVNECLLYLVLVPDFIYLSFIGQIKMLYWPQ